MKKKWCGQVAGISMLLLAVAGVGISAGEKPDFTVSGWGLYQAGQIVTGKYKGYDYDNIWSTNVLVMLSLKATFSDRLSAIVALEEKMWYDNFPLEENTLTENYPDKYFKTSIWQAEAVMKILESEKYSLTMEIGRFPYKYNPDVRNLGEYLFRTGTYQPFILTEFEYAFPHINGLLLSYTYDRWFSFDYILSSEADFLPYHDFSMTFIADASIGKVADLGAGIQFARLLPVNKDYTTPDKIYTNISGEDTSWISFRGVKLMGRAAINPLKFFKSSVFGPEDGKIYTEAAILGVKNYPPALNDIVFVDDTVQIQYTEYQNRAERMPIMFGVNVPMFKLVDVMALEFEWFGWKYPNSYESYLKRGGPKIVEPPQGEYTLSDYRKDDWKWSLNIRRMFMDHFLVCVQFARDHRFTVSNANKGMTIDFEEALTRTSHWAWDIRLGVYF